MEQFINAIVIMLAAMISFISCSKESQFDYPVDTLCSTWEGIDRYH